MLTYSRRTAFFVLLIASFTAVSSQAQEPAATLGLETLEPFVPKTPREEADEDRILSSILFAEGRLLFRREKYAEALQRYERAYRYSNQAHTIVSEIIPLAFRLGRNEEAIRYAELAGSGAKVDPFVLRRMAVALTEQQKYKAAATLYELTTSIPGDQDLSGAAVVTQFELGRLYFLIEEYEKSCDAFANVMQVMETAKPGSADAAAIEALMKQADATYSVMGESNFLANRYDVAAELFRKAHAEPKNEALLAFHLARIDEKEGRTQQALEQLQVYLDAKLDEAGTTPYQLLVDLLKQLERSNEVLERITALHEERPDNAFLSYFLADRLRAAEKYDEASELYLKVLDDKPSLEGYLGLMSCYVALDDDTKLLDFIGRTMADLDSLDAAEDSLKPLVEDTDRIKRLAELSRSRQAETNSWRAEAFAIATLATQTKQFDLVDEFYRKTAGEAPKADAQVWIAWGLELLLADETERAIEVFQEMLNERIPGRRTGEVLYYLSGALAIEDRFDEALKAAEDAARRSQGIPAIESRPAWILYLAKRWDEAESAYKEFVEKYDNDFRTAGARVAVREAKMTLSNICVFQEEFNDGMEWLEQVLDEYPADIGAYNDLGYLWADQGVHLRRSLKMTEQAVAAEPENAAYLDSLGWALYRLERYDEAVVQLKKAIEVGTPDPIILEHLADALQKAGDVQEARRVWQQALEGLDEEQNEERDRIKEKLQQYVLE